jgi:signal transduction histidine kinase
MDGADGEARWRHTRTLLLRLADDLGSAPLDRIPQLVVDAVLAATESEEAALCLRSGNRIVLRARAGSEAPVPALAAATDAALASGEPTLQRTPAGVSVAAPVVLTSGTEGALAVLQANASAIPIEETAERVGLFAAFAATALRTEAVLARRRDAALEAVHRLVARTAHELNNPLGGVKLYGRLIEQRLAKAGDGYGEGLAQKVGHAIDRLSRLIADFAERGRVAATSSDRVPINAVLTELLASVQDRLTTTPIEAGVELGKDVGEVTGDAEDLRRAFLHLLTNALDATPAGGRITVESRRPNSDTVEVVIEDHGAGMDAHTRDQALGLFFTTRPTAAGLGLATVRAAVDAHGGELDVESELGRGTRVTVRLPAAGR